MKALYIESVSGIAGDMFSAAFLDAGLLEARELTDLPKLLGLGGVEVVITKVNRASVQCTHVDVKIRTEEWKKNFGISNLAQPERLSVDFEKQKTSNLIFTEVDGSGENHWHVSYRSIAKFVKESALSAQVKSLALKIFEEIAIAEAAAHGIEIENVAFHEIGCVDSILDVVMAAKCVEVAGAGKIYSSPIKLGRGFIKIAHGTHPVPPPATAKLALGMPVDSVPEAITRPNLELSTPTGIAILKALNPTFVSEWPKGTIVKSGIGAGTMDLGAFPNICRIALLETGKTEALPYESDQVIQIEYLIDDDTPEHVSWQTAKLLELGALDVWTQIVTGKKGRMAFLCGILCTEEEFSSLADWILRHTTSFGLRHSRWDRLKLVRHFEERDLRYKVGTTTTGEKIKEKPEFESWAKSRESFTNS